MLAILGAVCVSISLGIFCNSPGLMFLIMGMFLLAYAVLEYLNVG